MTKKASPGGERSGGDTNLRRVERSGGCQIKSISNIIKQTNNSEQTNIQTRSTTQLHSTFSFTSFFSIFILLSTILDIPSMERACETTSDLRFSKQYTVPEASAKEGGSGAGGERTRRGLEEYAKRARSQNIQTLSLKRQRKKEGAEREVRGLEEGSKVLKRTRRGLEIKTDQFRVRGGLRLR